MRFTRLMLCSLFTLAASAAHANTSGCYLTDQPDLGGTKSATVGGAGVGPDLPSGMITKAGSLFLADGMAMAAYPGTFYGGDVFLVTADNEEIKASFKKTTGGSYINLSDIHSYFVRGYTVANSSQLNSFYCFKAGSPSAAKSSFFGNTLKTVYSGQKLHANANVGYSTNYEATLLDEGSDTVLRLTVTPFLPHGGQQVHYTVDFGNGEILIDRDADTYGNPKASHEVYNASNRMLLKGAAGEVLSNLDGMVHMNIVPNLPVGQLSEAQQLLFDFLRS